MSLLKPKILFSVARNLSTSSTRAAAWNKDWMPGKRPETEEEIKAAAKKYGLLPEEYMSYPDDGLGSGDYPCIKPIGAESRDKFYPWDNPEYRRNFGEVLHKDAVMYTEDRWNISNPPKYSKISMIAMFLAVMGAGYGLGILTEYACFLPVARHHMPDPGVKHYKYE